MTIITFDITCNLFTKILFFSGGADEMKGTSGDWRKKGKQKSRFAFGMHKAFTRHRLTRKTDKNQLPSKFNKFETLLVDV